MKNLRVVAVAFLMALSAVATGHAGRTSQEQQIGGIVGYLEGGTLRSTAEGVVIGAVAGGVVGAVVGGVATLPVGGEGAIPGAIIGGAIGGF
ncbi:MAG TPA: hypothetical protein VFV34_26950 [Blastocatellia bacterium]|nr:hypothetical protein [Blastocatellia bacterium]